MSNPVHLRSAQANLRSHMRLVQCWIRKHSSVKTFVSFKIDVGYQFFLCKYVCWRVTVKDVGEGEYVFLRKNSLCQKKKLSTNVYFGIDLLH